MDETFGAITQTPFLVSQSSRNAISSDREALGVVGGGMWDHAGRWWHAGRAL